FPFCLLPSALCLLLYFLLPLLPIDLIQLLVLYPIFPNPHNENRDVPPERLYNEKEKGSVKAELVSYDQLIP
ncbi:MAG TPA: hypothetical protein V6D48_06045, partial [Oculatellaceae cyanobacterium]